MAEFDPCWKIWIGRDIRKASQPKLGSVGEQESLAKFHLDAKLDTYSTEVPGLSVCTVSHAESESESKPSPLGKQHDLFFGAIGYTHKQSVKVF